MGKKGKKTRWRRLPIGGTDEESGLSLERAPPTTDQHRITFNEDEYTKITTPRQDVLFKKGYFGRKKTTTTTPASPSDTPDLHSNDSVESESYVGEEQQYAYPVTTGYMDPSGVYYVNGNTWEAYDPYTGTVTVVVGPPSQYPGAPPVLAALPCQPVPLQPVEWFNPPAPWCYSYNRRKRYSTDSQNCSAQSSESTGPPGSPQEPVEEGAVACVSSAMYATQYVYPGYMFGPPVYNMNGMTVQGMIPHQVPASSTDFSASKRRKKRRRRRRGGVTDDGSESSCCEEVDTAGCQSETSSDAVCQSGASSDAGSKGNSDSGIHTDPTSSPPLPNPQSDEEVQLYHSPQVLQLQEYQAQSTIQVLECQAVLHIQECQTLPTCQETLEIQEFQMLPACHDTLQTHQETFPTCQETLQIQEYQMLPACHDSFQTHQDTLHNQEFQTLPACQDTLQTHQETLYNQEFQTLPACQDAIQTHQETLYNQEFQTLSACQNTLQTHQEVLHDQECQTLPACQDTLQIQELQTLPKHQETLQIQVLETLPTQQGTQQIQKSQTVPSCQDTQQTLECPTLLSSEETVQIQDSCKHPINQEIPSSFALDGTIESTSSTKDSSCGEVTTPEEVSEDLSATEGDVTPNLCLAAAELTSQESTLSCMLSPSISRDLLLPNNDASNADTSPEEVFKSCQATLENVSCSEENYDGVCSSEESNDPSLSMCPDPLSLDNTNNDLRILCDASEEEVVQRIFQNTKEEPEEQLFEESKGNNGPEVKLSFEKPEAAQCKEVVESTPSLQVEVESNALCELEGNSECKSEGQETTHDIECDTNTNTPDSRGSTTAPVPPPRRKRSMCRAADKVAAKVVEEAIKEATEEAAHMRLGSPVSITEAVTRWLNSQGSSPLAYPAQEDESEDEMEEGTTGPKNVRGNPFLASSHSDVGTRVAKDCVSVASSATEWDFSRTREMCDPAQSVDKYYRLGADEGAGERRSPSVYKTAMHIRHNGPFPCGVCCIIQ